MTRLLLSRRAVFVMAVVAVASTTLLSPLTSTASAAVDDVPTVRVKIVSVALDGYTGNVVVVARVRCTQTVDGTGSASWHVHVVQERRAQVGAPIACDGLRHRATLQLDPKRGRFHPGQVNLTVEQTAIGSRTIEIQSSSFSTTV